MYLYKMYLNKVVFLYISIIVGYVQSARILCVFPVPSFSHQIVFREYTKELAKNGHELVIITPNPHLSKDRPKDNVTEIDVSFIYNSMIETMKEFGKQDLLIRGVAVDIDKFDDKQLVDIIDTLFYTEFEHPSVKELFKNRKEDFDLIVLEGYYEYSLIVTKFFKAPTIMISSFYGTAENLDAVGAVNRHPVMYPSFYRSNFNSNTIWEKLYGIYKEIKQYYTYHNVEIGLDSLLKARYGPETPSIRELRKNVDLLFLNSHPIYDSNRPVPPNVIYLGSLHLQQVKELPQDLKTYLDNSKTGVVYVSLGTNVHTVLFDQSLMDAFLKAFEALPFDVIWKHNGEVKDKPKNVRIEKWVPQRDLLKHPNIKLFVTQGGRQSLDEAIDAGVPIVGIPTLGDQIYNIKKSVDFGICKEVNFLTLEQENFLQAMLTVLENHSYYKKNILRLRTIIKDEPETPIERAVWWTEYLLRHGGSKHLKSPLANLSWCEYLMLDVVIAVAATAVVTVAALVFSLQSFIKSFYKGCMKSRKLKSS